ncbi:unnamed protein product [Anisakis simplex]|uniref:MARVEL domain-containing protein n=1 Tax=Anisakis simplex TaxID=6269 RepID=A0A0M3J3B4_ANISI|nr:unnamed protein product [Anisakis simplex]
MQGKLNIAESSHKSMPTFSFPDGLAHFNHNDRSYRCCCGLLHIKTAMTVSAIVYSMLLVFLLAAIIFEYARFDFYRLLTTEFTGVISILLIIHAVIREDPLTAVIFFAVQIATFIVMSLLWAFGFRFGAIFDISIGFCAHPMFIAIGYFGYKYFSDWRSYRQRPSISYTMRTDQ